MRFANVLRVYRTWLRPRAIRVQQGLAVAGIAVGVALLFASQVASTSLTRSVGDLTHGVIGSQQQWQLQARGPGGFGERMLGEVRRLPGVGVALPVLEQETNVIGPRGERAVDLIGIDPRFARLGGPLLRRFSAAQLGAQQAIALPAPIAGAIGAGPLQTIRIQVGANLLYTLLGATLQEGDVGALVNSPIALAPVAYAQRLTGMHGRITRVFVRPQRGRSGELHRELAVLAARTGVNLEPATSDGTLFATAVAPASKSEALFSAISALVGFIFAFEAMLMSSPARRRLIDTIRPSGATRVMILQVILLDAALLGVAGCVLGLALGDLLSLAVFKATPGYLAFAFPVGNYRIVTVEAVALALAAGLVAALVGVLWPLRDLLAPGLARTGGPSSQRSRRRLGWRAARVLAGLVCLAVTAIVLLADPSAAVLGNVVLVIALLCLLPSLFEWLLTLFERTQRGFNDASTRLAVAGLRGPQTRVRALAIAATAAVAVFGIVEFQGTQANLARGLDASARGIDQSADVWVTAAGESNAFATTPFAGSNRCPTGSS
jgi:putative ABC transport system permease protein